MVRETVAAGVGVLLVSSELDELLALSDRVLIMAGGRLSPTSAEGRGESDLRAALQAESARARQGTEASP